eukprot:TRINITY_DN11657_c0_g1_i1.p1 TRINITY_DN11657_c0_g1~~TRINITY_DN11657_c0_g1_i1.p1  ORF type:complete len:247 (-),score=54.52 TRINITY_DN11657_c0_g1_i1:7-747(-)
MNYLSLVGILPTVLETKQEDVFTPVVLKTNEKVACLVKNASKPDHEVVDHESTLATEHLKQQISDLNKKNEYLSSNIIETNSHLLSIYKRIRSLENEKKGDENIKKENVFLFQKLRRVEDENVRLQKQSEDFNISQKTHEDEMIAMKQKIAKFDNLEDELIFLKHKFENIGNFENVVSSEIKSLCQSIPLFTKGKVGSHKFKNLSSEKNHEFESMLIRYMLPSIITVAAIVMNMYLYLSTNNKFPI